MHFFFFSFLSIRTKFHGIVNDGFRKVYKPFDGEKKIIIIIIEKKQTKKPTTIRVGVPMTINLKAYSREIKLTITVHFI